MRRNNPGRITPSELLPSLPSGARLLIIRLRSIGDIVLLTPALRLVKEWRPDLDVTVMVESRFRELLAGNSDVDHIFPLRPGKGPAKALSQAVVVREMRRPKFAVCLNLHGGPTSTLLTRLSGSDWKIGFHHFRSPRTYDFVVPDALPILGRPFIHTAELEAFAFFWLGLPRQDVPRARLAVDPAHVSWWRDQRRTFGLPESSGYAVVHPTAVYSTKRWAPEHFARLGDWLESKAGIPCLYTCGPGEEAVLDAVERAGASFGHDRPMRRPMRRLEVPGLGQFAAALSEARLFVGNDSGPAHMAAALARPLVVIFGSSNSALWGPWPVGQSISRIVQNPFDCNPCPGDRCYRFDQPECIRSISFEQVRDAVLEVLRGLA